jgi:ribose transport system substrate-binding protein
MFEATGLSIYLSTESAIKQTLAPCTSCSVSTVPFDFTTSGTTLPAAVVVYLKANPSTNYLFFDFSGAVDGVPAALQSAGITGVKILTTDTTTTESAYLKNGQENVAAGIPWPEVLWGDLNAVMRYDMKLPVAPALNVHFPNMLLTGANLPPATTGGIVPLIGNYKSIFEKAWHVGG